MYYAIVPLVVIVGSWLIGFWPLKLSRTDRLDVVYVVCLAASLAGAGVLYGWFFASTVLAKPAPLDLALPLLIAEPIMLGIMFWMRRINK